MSVGGPNTPGDWAVLLGQCQVFFTMVFSVCILRARFTVVQVLGATLVVIGSSMAILPHLSCRCSALVGKVGYVIVYFLSDAPYALAAVYKDFAFKTAALDVYYLTAFVSWTQLVISWCYLPLLSIPAFGGTPLSSIPESLSDGAKCFFGDTSVKVYDSDNVFTGYCGANVTVSTLCYSLSCFLLGITNLYIMQKGSATLYVLTIALCVPIANLSFSVPALMMAVGLEPDSFSWYNFAGVVMVVVGFVAYALVERSVAVEDSESSLLDGGENCQSVCEACKVENTVDGSNP